MYILVAGLEHVFRIALGISSSHGCWLVVWNISYCSIQLGRMIPADLSCLWGQANDKVGKQARQSRKKGQSIVL